MTEEEQFRRLLTEEPEPLRCYRVTFTYESGKTVVQPFIAYDRKTAKRIAEDFIRQGFAHIDGDRLVRAQIDRRGKK